MTKNPNSGFLFFSFRDGGGGSQGKAAQGEVLAREWEQLLSYVTHCIDLIHSALHFHQDGP